MIRSHHRLMRLLGSPLRDLKCLQRRLASGGDPFGGEHCSPFPYGRCRRGRTGGIPHRPREPHPLPVFKNFPQFCGQILRLFCCPLISPKGGHQRRFQTDLSYIEVPNGDLGFRLSEHVDPQSLRSIVSMTAAVRRSRRPTRAEEESLSFLFSPFPISLVAVWAEAERGALKLRRQWQRLTPVVKQRRSGAAPSARPAGIILAMSRCSGHAAGWSRPVKHRVVHGEGPCSSGTLLPSKPLRC